MQRVTADPVHDMPPTIEPTNKSAAQSLPVQKPGILACKERSKFERWLVRTESRSGSVHGAVSSQIISIAPERRSSSGGALGACAASLMPSSNSSLIQRLKEASAFAAAAKDSVGSGPEEEERAKCHVPGTELPPSFKSYLAGVEARARRSSSTGLASKPPTSPLSRAGSSSLGRRASESGGALHMMTHGY